MPRQRLGADLVGRAFRCEDGVIRWVVGQTASTRNLHIRWLAEDTGVWHFGGMRNPKSWPERGAPVEEVPAPQPGETYVYIGLTATRATYRRGAAGEADVRVFDESELAAAAATYHPPVVKPAGPDTVETP